MLNGTLEIEIEAVEPLSIHGSEYYNVVYRIASSDGQGERQGMRINPEAFYPDPKPGDRVAVNMVMGNIMGAEKLN